VKAYSDGGLGPEREGAEPPLKPVPLLAEAAPSELVLLLSGPSVVPLRASCVTAGVSDFGAHYHPSLFGTHKRSVAGRVGRRPAYVLVLT
jgi:hypothetical protein